MVHNWHPMHSNTCNLINQIPSKMHPSSSPEGGQRVTRQIGSSKLQESLHSQLQNCLSDVSGMAAWGILLLHLLQQCTASCTPMQSSCHCMYQCTYWKSQHKHQTWCSLLPLLKSTQDLVQLSSLEHAAVLQWHTPWQQRALSRWEGSLGFHDLSTWSAQLALLLLNQWTILKTRFYCVSQAPHLRELPFPCLQLFCWHAS